MPPRDREIGKIHRHGRIRITIGHPVRPGTALQPVCARAPFQNIVAATTPYPVIPIAPIDVIRNGVSDNHVVSRPGDVVFNNCIAGNREVANLSVHVRNPFRAQVHLLVTVIRPQVQSISATVVIQR